MHTTKFKLLTALILTASLMSPCVMASATEDAQITARLIDLVKQENDLPIESLDITTRDRVVKLNGNLETMLQANRAVELAYSIDRVQDVESNIEIKDSDQYLKDALITARARGKVLQLARDGKIAKNYHLHFETTNGHLHMIGEVGKKHDVVTLQNELVKVKGVKNLQANVRAK